MHAYRLVCTGIRVKDMDDSLKFYTEVLGMQFVEKREQTPPTKGEVATLKSPGGDHPKPAPLGIPVEFKEYLRCNNSIQMPLGSFTNASRHPATPPISLERASSRDEPYSFRPPRWARGAGRIHPLASG